MEAIAVMVFAALLATGVAVDAKRRRQTRALELKLDRVLRRLGVDPNSGDLRE